MSEQLDRDKLYELALLGGDSRTARYGEVMLNRSANRSRKSSVGNGFVLDSETGEIKRDPNYAAYEQERDARDATQRAQLQADMMARLGYSADLRARQPRFTSVESEGGVTPLQTNPNAPGGARAADTIAVTRPVSDSDRQKAAEYDRLAQEASGLMGELSKTQGVISSPKDILTEAVASVPIIGRGTARATQEGMYGPEQLSVKTRGARFEQNLSNLAAGMALTGYEIEQRDRWSPFATGISQKESSRRLVNIERDFGSRAASVRGANRPASESSGTDGLPMSTPTRKRVRVDAEGNVIGN